MNVSDLRTKNTVNISYNISRMENNRRMEYSNEDNNTDKPTAIKKILIYLRTKRWPRCTETVHLHRTAIFMQLQRSPAILKNSPYDSTCGPNPWKLWRKTESEKETYDFNKRFFSSLFVVMTRYNPTNPANILSRSLSGTVGKPSNKCLSSLREVQEEVDTKSG